MREGRVHPKTDRGNCFGVRGISALLRTIVAAVLLYTFGCSAAYAQEDAKNILILFSFSDRRDYRGLSGLKSALHGGVPFPLNFNVEYLEGRRLDDKEYEKGLVETLGHTYHGAKLDLILIQSYTGLRFVLSHRGALFPGVPIIFLDIDPGQIAGQGMPPGVTGVTGDTGVRDTVDLAIHLHPNANTVAVIISNSTPDKFFFAQIQDELVRYKSKVREVDLVGLTPSQLRTRVAALPTQTVVLFQMAAQESVQPAIGSNDVLEWIAQRLPTYGIFPLEIINHGGIGGFTYEWDTELSMVAGEARRVLSGERADNIPVLNESAPQPHVDWRALQRWHIPESALPAGSVILHPHFGRAIEGT